jgi:ATP-binding cassette, subfamily B, multidrug efflux pump
MTTPGRPPAAGPMRPGMGPMRHQMGMGASGEKPADFRGSLARLSRRLGAERIMLLPVVLLAGASVAMSVIGPKLLGDATNLVFDGVVSKHLPAHLTQAQIIAGLRATGRSKQADLLSGMTLNPGHGVDFAAVGHTLMLTLGVYLIASVCSWGQGYLMVGVTQRTIYRLREDVEGKLARLPLSYFDRTPRGDILSRVTNDIDNIATTLQQTLTQMLTSVLTVIGVLGMMLWISPLLALVALTTVPLSFVVTVMIAKRSQPHFADQWRWTGKLNSHVEEMYSGHNIVKVFGHRKAAIADFDAANEQLYTSSRTAQFISGIIMPSMNFIANLNYVLIAVIGGLRVASGSLSLGDVQAFIQYSRQFTMPITQIASIANLMQSGMASAERVFTLLDEAEEPADTPVADLGDTKGTIRFEDVSFCYSPDKPLIEHLNLTVTPGQSVAIVGPTGAGKTTLVNLLMRFYDVQGGRITLDGVDIRDVARDDLRGRFGMVLQDTWLFNGTIRDNIGYGKAGASAQEIIEAAAAAHVDGYVRTLPDGYDTIIGGDSDSLSAGQRQLMTIARAYLSDPSVLILDEATSSVDTRTELLIQRALADLRAQRTSFVIAHRLSTIRDADMIIVMEAGAVVETGTHSELLAAGGAYYRLYTSQFEAAVDDETLATVTGRR